MSMQRSLKTLLSAALLLGATLANDAHGQPTYKNGVAPNGVPDNATAENVVEAPPAFFNAEGNDYRPDNNAGSPLIDLSTTEPHLGRKLNGQNQTLGAWDAGAYESHGSALPVELASTDAYLAGDKAILEWTTAQETNNAGFTVEERMNDAWQRIGRINGHGTTSQPRTYRFTDDRVARDQTLTYRLKQHDVNGATTIEDTLTVNHSPEQFTAEVNPNPVRGTAELHVNAAKDYDDISINVYDVLGRHVKTVHDGRLQDGFHEYRINAGSLASGPYFFQATSDNGVQHSGRFTVTR